jgi:hypothetical protein
VSSHGAEHVPGHGAREIERLIRQPELVEPITRRFFVEARIAPGAPTLRSEAIIGAGSNSFEQVRFTTDTLIALLPHLETLVGVISPAKSILRASRLGCTESVAAKESVVVGRTEIGAWSRVSGVTVSQPEWSSSLASTAPSPCQVDQSRRRA